MRPCQSLRLHLRIVDEDDCSIVEEQHFDTHLSEDNSAAMQTYVENLPSGTMLLVAVQDEAWEKLTPALKTTMADAFGTQELASLGWRDSYAAILVKGHDPLDEQHKTRYEGSAEATATPEREDEDVEVTKDSAYPITIEVNDGVGRNEEQSTYDEGFSHSLTVGEPNPFAPFTLPLAVAFMRANTEKLEFNRHALVQRQCINQTFAPTIDTTSARRSTRHLHESISTTTSLPSTEESRCIFISHRCSDPSRRMYRRSGR